MATQAPNRPLARRWENLPGSSRALLTAVSLHEGDLPDGLLMALAPDPTAVDAAMADGWLEELPNRQWRLATEAESIRSLAPWSMRRAAHLALAGHLQRQPDTLARAAAHFEAGGRPDDAGRLWLAAARANCQRHNHQAAGHSFAEAIRLLPDLTPENELVDAVRDFGVCAGLRPDTCTALALLGQWRRRASWQALPIFQGHAARICADLLCRSGQHIEGSQTRREAAQHFLKAGLGAEATSELLAAATTLVWALRFRAARETAAEALELARRQNRADLESNALAALGLTHGMLGEINEGRASLGAALDLALKHRLTAQVANAYRLMGNVDDYASRYDTQSSFLKAISYCDRHDHARIADLCRGCLSYSLFRGGRWSEALEIAVAISEKPGAPEDSRAAGTLVHGMIRVMRGELRRGSELVELGLQLGRKTGVGAIELFAWPALAAIHEMSHRPADAASCYTRLMEAWQTSEDRHDVLPGFCAAVTFFVGQGDRETAAKFAAQLQRIVALTSNPEALASADYAAAELNLHEDRAAEAVQLFQQALVIFEKHRCSIELIRTRLRLAVALVANDNRPAAIVALREARLRAVRLGSRPLIGLAEKALASLAKSKPVRTGSFNALSPRQRDVAAHLQSGRTNKEIAAALGLSVRTVDMHVAHLFDRLDCRTRTEAAARLSELAELAPA